MDYRERADDFVVQAEMHCHGSHRWLVCGVESIEAITKWLYLHRITFMMFAQAGIDPNTNEPDDNVTCDHAILYIQQNLNQLDCIKTQIRPLMKQFLLEMRGFMFDEEIERYIMD